MLRKEFGYSQRRDYSNINISHIGIGYPVSVCVPALPTTNDLTVYTISVYTPNLSQAQKVFLIFEAPAGLVKVN